MNQLLIEYGTMFHLINGNRDHIHLLETKDFVYQEPKKIFELIKKNPKIQNIEICNKLKVKASDFADRYQWIAEIPFESIGVNEIIKNSVKREMQTAKLTEQKAILERLETLNNEKIETNSVRHLLDSFENNKSKEGLRTGFSDLDNITKGFKHSHFWVVGAYSNTGKSQFAVQCAISALNQNAKTLFLTIEMREDDLMERFWRYASHRIGEDKAMKYFTQREKIFNVTNKIYRIEDIEKIVVNNNYDFVVIDFLQLIEIQAKTEYEKMTEIARRIQKLAQTTDTCILALSQISEDFAKQKKVETLTFKGSGGILNASDIGILLKRDFESEDKRRMVDFEVIIRKNRFGLQGKIGLQFDKKTGFIE